MKNDVTELVFILDKSGSMSGMERDTIGGFNAMIEKQKDEDGRFMFLLSYFQTTHKFCMTEKV